MTFRRPDGREIPPQELPTERALRSGETVFAEEMVIQLPDGQLVPTIVNARPIVSEEGEIVSVVATIQDMTPVEELERLRSEFLGMVSQQLRVPLAAIKGTAAPLSDSTSPLDSAEMRQSFRIIDEQADRMRDLINHLLDATRINAGALSVSPEPTDVAEVVHQAREAFERGGARNRIDVDLPAALSQIGADRPRIVQVLSNLFSNASKHSPESSTIKVTVSQEEFHVSICVADEGRGVSAERLPHLFKRFSRINGEEETHNIEGTGLGLAICRGIVEAHGGRIWADSDGPGLGTRFTFTIPAVEEAVGGSAPGAGRLSSDSGLPAWPRILAVDDEQQTLRHIRNALSEAGYTPIITVDPKEAERLIKVEKPHLVLLDLTLTGTDGFELMRRISAITDAPVIILSGRFDDQTIARAFEMGAADYVAKPFSPTELVSRTRAALRKGSAFGQARPLEPYALGNLKIGYAQRRVTVDGRPVRLTATEYNLLVELSANAGNVLTYDQLLQRVWGSEYSGNARLLHAFVKTLRRKLGDDARNPSFIFTEFRVGYRMPKS